MIKTCYINILESSTVSLEAGTEDSSYPLYRLYDRHIGRVFKSTAAETIEVLIDQGASGNLAADRLIIPAGHNLDGMTLDIKYSDDDVTYYSAVTQWVQSGSGIINKEWTSITHRYWKFIITSPASIPQFAELFLTQTYEFEKDPTYPTGPLQDIHNVEHLKTKAGGDRFLVNGDPKKQRIYNVQYVKEAQKGNIIALHDAVAGSKPFWIEDHEGTWFYCMFKEPIDIYTYLKERYNFVFEVEEVL